MPLYDYDYEQDLQTNFEDLDRHWLEQPQKYMKWGERWSNAIAKRDRAKENLDVTRAEIDKEIRKGWDKPPWEFDSKPTETAISSAIITDDRYRHANSEYIDAGEEVNIMLVAKTAFEHRKKQLDNLTSLYLSGWFTRPRLQGDRDPDYPLGDPQQKALSKQQKPKRKPRLIKKKKED